MHLLRSVVPLVILPFLLQGHAYPQRAGHLTEIRSEALEGREADTEWNGKLVGCNPEEEDAVRIAVAVASGYILEAVKYLDGLTEATPRYREWFGDWDPKRFSRVRDRFHKLNNAKFSSWTYTCTLSGYCHEYTIAFVFPKDISAGKHDVHICPPFLKLPDTAQVRSSKGGTIIHEGSHHFGTLDSAARVNECQDIASSNPEEAVNNAQNYALFAENTDELD